MCKMVEQQLVLFMVALCLLLLNCRRETQEQILVRIGDKSSITVNEFIRRAEYTPRPDYCKGNTYIHKKIILNSLIAEKILALEAGPEAPLLKEEVFIRFIKGRKEQAMRQWMYHVEAAKKVNLKEEELKKVYKLAGRAYEIVHFSVNDSSLAHNIKNILNQDSTLFDSVYYTLTGQNQLPERTVIYNAQEHLKVHTALFSEALKIGQILEPIRIADDDYLFIKIRGWSDNLAMTDLQRQRRHEMIEEKLTWIKASVIWNERVAGIMRGKTLDFDENTFYQVRDLFFEIYFRTSEQKKKELTERIWGNDEQEIDRAITGNLTAELLARPFFTIDGQTWSVNDFRKSLISHPLVFRKLEMDAGEFSKQFKFAIADLIRDYYVTQEAYKAGYDKVNIVERNVNMWRDTFLAYEQKHAYLKSVGETRNFAANYKDILKERLNPYIDVLQRKYYKQIELDFDRFEEIGLTSIDLFVKQPRQPFQYVVPLFPVITTDNLIEYLRKMDK